jgi:ribosomal protein L40E
MMITCPKCTFQNIDTAVYCGNCGVELSPKVVCQNCGQTNSASLKFCNYCGTRISESSPCPKCGHENDPEAKFCGKCGVNLVGDQAEDVVEITTTEDEPPQTIETQSPDITICSNCGFTNEKDAINCTNCNQILGKDSVSDIIQEQVEEKTEPSSGEVATVNEEIVSKEESRLRICPKCGTKNSTFSKYCSNCDTKLRSTVGTDKAKSQDETSSYKRCSYCFENIPADAVRCPYCGYSYRDSRRETLKPRQGFSLFSGQGCLIVILVAAVILLYATNPSQSDHNKSIIANAGREVGETYGGELGGWLGQLVGGGIGGIANQFDLSLFTYHNYLLFSTTNLGMDTISVGYLGNVRIVMPASEWAIEILKDLPTGLEIPDFNP